MLGASKLVEQFDRSNLDEEHPQGEGGTVFAGGGRGLLVVPEEHADTTIHRLRHRYCEQTCGGQLATAKAPLDVERPLASLRWLRLGLDGAKDAADAPEVPVPPSHDGRCTDCKVRAIETTYEGPEGPVPACERCARAVAFGRNSDEQRWTLEELATDGLIAVVSADGNNLGRLFAGLRDLQENAICSDLVFSIFTDAHQHACPKDARFVAPVVGGDDIRVFLPPEHLIDYVTKLARRVEELSSRIAHPDLPSSIGQAISRLGVGVGAVIAPFHFPASRLIEMAHEFEDSAKRLCLRGGHRSAFDFMWLRSGQELSQGLGTVTKERPSALPLETTKWQQYLAKASALSKVSPTQRSMLIPRTAVSEEDVPERANLYRYQVARHEVWRQWFEDCGVDWRDEVALASNLPDARLVDVACLLEMSGKAGRR
ncbi:Cas10/Cmr2 second palm domain-containing protein [Paraliomyxa miuraensis]|uniref:Cas10/Cmr2 second palm domain-containing protein n=1 Tax=Paraliomyxa miuraensis TaxID=376150 RepID=UPI00224FDF88|nr:hypothetical protein [Paraliomyxa miuraensis]MCX4242506.1 hypothetical protein [Paraliomyxa miuraensis]